MLVDSSNSCKLSSLNSEEPESIILTCHTYLFAGFSKSEHVYLFFTVVGLIWFEAFDIKYLELKLITDSNYISEMMTDHV